MKPELYALYDFVIYQLSDWDDDEYDHNALLRLNDRAELRFLHTQSYDQNPSPFICDVRVDNAVVASMTTKPDMGLTEEDFVAIWEWAMNVISVSKPVPVGVAFEEDGDIEVTWYDGATEALTAMKNALKEAVAQAEIDTDLDFLEPDGDQAGFNYSFSWTEYGAYLEVHCESIHWQIIYGPVEK